MATFSINTQKTWAILIGTSQYASDSGFGALPAVETNLKQLCRLLKRPDIIGIDNDARILLLEDKTLDEIILQLKSILKEEIADTLIVYYAGHGLLRSGSLYLAAHNTPLGTPQLALNFNDLWELTYQKAHKLLYILDCCFSGNVFQDDHSDWTTEALKRVKKLPDKVISFLISSLPYAVSKAPVGSSYTLYTGHLLELLEKGCGSESVFLTPLQVHEELTVRLTKQNPLFKPWHHDFHSGQFCFAKNIGHESLESVIELERAILIRELDELEILKTKAPYMSDGLIDLGKARVSEHLEMIRAKMTKKLQLR